MPVIPSSVENFPAKSLFLGGGGVTKETFKNAFKKVKLISTSSWFLGIFLVSALIMKVENNIQPQNEQNVFRTGGGLPLPHPHLHLKFTETSDLCWLDQKSSIPIFFFKVQKDWRPTSRMGVEFSWGGGGSVGDIYQGGIFHGCYFLGGGVFSEEVNTGYQDL